MGSHAEQPVQTHEAVNTDGSLFYNWFMIEVLVFWHGNKRKVYQETGVEHLL